MTANESENMNEVHIANIPTEIDEQDETSNVGSLKLKVYKRRWLMLFIYVICAVGAMFQWLEYGIIANIVTRYYAVPPLLVEWTSMFPMMFYVVFIFPVLYLTNKYGLRWIIIVSGGLSWLGAFMKIFSVHPDRFYFIIIGKSIAAIAQTITIPLSGRVAAQWFPSHELSTATSLGVLGCQLGIACSYFFPSVIVKNHESLDDIGNDLSRFAWTLVSVTTIAFLLILILFQDEPNIPPSETRALQKINRAKRDDKFIETIKRFLRNRNFIMHCNVYGLSLGVTAGMFTLLNPIILEYFQNAEEDVGRIGFCIISVGLLGSITFGIILDKTHKFKETGVIAYFLSFLSCILFTTFMYLQVKWMVYVSGALVGFFITGYMTVAYEIAIEYNYPEPENIYMGIMNVTSNIYGTITIIIFGILLKMYGSVPIFIVVTVSLLTGFILSTLMKDKQKRQDARKKTQSEELARIVKKDHIDDIPVTSTFIHNVN